MLLWLQNAYSRPKHILRTFFRQCRFAAWGSNFGHVVALATILSNIFTAHAQKRLFVNFPCKFQHHRSTFGPPFRIRMRNVGNLGTSSIEYIFGIPARICILPMECSNPPNRSTKKILIGDYVCQTCQNSHSSSSCVVSAFLHCDSKFCAPLEPKPLNRFFSLFDS